MTCSPFPKKNKISKISVLRSFLLLQYVNGGGGGVRNDSVSFTFYQLLRQAKIVEEEYVEITLSNLLCGWKEGRTKEGLGMNLSFCLQGVETQTQKNSLTANS